MAATRYFPNNGASAGDKYRCDGVRVRTYAENNSCSIEAVGDYATILALQPKTGTAITDTYLKNLLPALPTGEGTNWTWGVQNSTVNGEAGEMATLTISCVQVNGLNGAYDEQWDVDMQEVQRSLKQHPTVLGDSAALQIIQLWEATPEAVRMYTDSSGLQFRYYNNLETTTQGVLTKVTNTVAKNYLLAVAAGIETYNVYLPVVSRTTKYLKSYSNNVFPCSTVGHFENPTVVVGGTGSGKWFKSCDKMTRSMNGTFTRTEQWTYTDDTKHDWIYSAS